MFSLSSHEFCIKKKFYVNIESTVNMQNTYKLYPQCEISLRTYRKPTSGQRAKRVKATSSGYQWTLLQYEAMTLFYNTKRKNSRRTKRFKCNSFCTISQKMENR